MPERSAKAAPQQTRFGSLRRLAIFQVKLAADALRDVMLSPISIIAFVMDAITKPTERDSMHRKLMRLGRRSDRFINLFDEYKEAPHPTIDNTIDGLETRIRREAQARQAADGSERSAD